MNTIKKNRERKINEIENRLRYSLQPVTPRPSYINGLHGRLMDTPHLQVIFDRNKPIQFLLFGLAGIIGLIFILVAIARLILSILGVLGLLRYAKRHRYEENMKSMINEADFVRYS